MATLSGLFDLTRSSLGADQAALDATAKNVANQNTAGYTREVVNWQAGDSVTLGSGAVEAGGVQVSTTSARDRVLDQRVQQETQQQAGTSARSDVLTQIDNVFSVTADSTNAGSTQIGTAIDGFFSSLTALAGDPSDPATQQAVLSAASTMASAFNSASTQLASVGTSINGAIATSVPQVNALTATIAGLNAQIAQVSPNGDAGALEDQRQLAITQLSQYVGLNQISTENNGITLTTEGGTVLVAGATSSSLTAVTNGSGTTSIVDSAGTDVSAGIQGGSIGGQLTAQHTDLPAVTSALDALAYRVATAVNTQNETGVTSTSTAGTAIFTLPATATGAAAAMAVIPTDASAVTAAAVGEGSSGNGNANALAALAQATDASGQTISGQLGAMLSQVGTSASTLSEQNTTEQASLTQLTTQQSNLSSVSLDEEASNLSLFQRSYEAGAKLLSTLDTLMADAINLGTQTTVS